MLIGNNENIAVSLEKHISVFLSFLVSTQKLQKQDLGVVIFAD